jgi:hypothetical protein
MRAGGSRFLARFLARFVALDSTAERALNFAGAAAAVFQRPKRAAARGETS